MAAGRPPKYSTPEELQKKIDSYFNGGCNVRKIVVGEEVVEVPLPTITGLALYLGFCSRNSFYAYEAKPKFKYTIKKARLAIENIYEEMLHRTNCTGAIFALKNFGWKDRQEISGEVTYIHMLKEAISKAAEIDEVYSASRN